MWTISVVIPVKNGASTLNRCIKTILLQNNIIINEIIILDSKSSDNSIDIAKSFNAKIISVDPLKFNHGLTRNIALEFVTGELIYYTVQDAFIADCDMLFKMASHFSKDEIAAVCGHQAVPHEKDKNPVIWFNRFSEPISEIRKLEPDESFQKMDIKRKKKLISFDNVVAMYRKTRLQEIPFRKTDFAEDRIWCSDALIAGFTLVYDPSIVVFHYHHLIFDYVYRVNFILNYHMYIHFNIIPERPIFFLAFLKFSKSLIENRFLNMNEKLYWWAHNFKIIISQYASYIHFIYAIRSSNMNFLNREYYKLCKKVPQGIQNNNHKD